MNPNFLATAPHRVFFELGSFVLEEAERSGLELPDGVGALLARPGICCALNGFAEHHETSRMDPTCRRRSPSLSTISVSIRTPSYTS